MSSKLDPDAIIAAVEADEDTGFCTACGAEHMSIEPDAHGYECEECGAMAVSGAEELLISGACG